MAGHSKWANIKHKKAASDAVKGKVFSKIAKEIMVASRLGGGDASANITLRSLVQKARAANMPMDNIERAIKKGTGELAGDAMEEIVYEGFAPGGVAVVIACLSDNRNRTAADVRFVFTKQGGNLGQQGSVIRTFNRKGQMFIDSAAVEEDKLIELALEAGAEDIQRDGESYEVLTDPSAFNQVLEALTEAGLEPKDAEVTLLPEVTTAITEKDKAEALMKFISALEDLDDVQNVYAAFDMEDALLDEVTA